jgi:hypothetical protein
MRDKIICRNCDIEHDIKDVPWTIGRLKKYRGKFITCSCGQELQRLYPTDEATLKMWQLFGPTAHEDGKDE